MIRSRVCSFVHLRASSLRQQRDISLLHRTEDDFKSDLLLSSSGTPAVSRDESALFLGWNDFAEGGFRRLYKVVNGGLSLSSVAFQFQHALKEMALQIHKRGVLRVDTRV